jgi:hypothetical protein
MELRAGQKWRDVSGVGAQIITIEGIDGGAVHGTYASEGAPAGLVGANVWSARDFDEMVLISDPEWATHRVVVPGVYNEADATETLGRIGVVQGMQSMTLSPSGAPRVWVDVVASDERAAIERVLMAVGHFERIDADGIHVNNDVPDRG